MAIRIRVYPQPNSVGARRNRARRRQQQVINQQRQQLQQLRLQQQLMRQQQVLQQSGFGFPTGFSGGAMGALPGAFMPGLGLPPQGSSWGFQGGYAYQPVGTAWNAGYAMPGFASALAPTVMAPVAQHGYGC